jgi:uncharacterized membrane protein HdeD (DUF308 family)
MAGFSAVRTLAAHWWVLLLRGLIAILFGICAYVWSGPTLAVVVLLFGAYALVDGIFSVVAGIRGKWGALIFLGILGIAAGLITLFYPGITATALVWVIAFWAILIGIMQISAAIRLRKEVQGEWLWILSGILCVVLGVLLIARPGVGAVSILWTIAAFAIVWGILLCILAFKVKKMGELPIAHATA